MTSGGGDWQHDVLRELRQSMQRQSEQRQSEQRQSEQPQPEQPQQPEQQQPQQPRKQQQPQPLALPVPPPEPEPVPHPAPTPTPTPTLDPRLSLALGRPRHGDSIGRRAGRSLRKLASSAAQDVAEEARVAEQLQQPVTTGRVVAVTSIRGGVGKTSVSALLARAFMHYRHDQVLALDADAALGTLPVRLGTEEVRWSCSDVARLLTPSMTLADVTEYLVRVPGAAGGWLLPASQGRVGAPLDLRTYRKVTLALRRYFAVTVADCESLPGEVARTAMDTAHARVVVAPLTAEGVGGTRIVLEWLGRLPHPALSTTVVALTAVSPDMPLDAKAAVSHLKEAGVPVVSLPYDRHLAGGGPIRTDLLGRATRRAATRLAADVMERAVRAR
ncbi:nucleotide-binding protein [Streptomyces abikoensis]